MRLIIGIPNTGWRKCTNNLQTAGCTLKRPGSANDYICFRKFKIAAGIQGDCIPVQNRARFATEIANVSNTFPSEDYDTRFLREICLGNGSADKIESGQQAGKGARGAHANDGSASFGYGFGRELAPKIETPTFLGKDLVAINENACQ